MPKRLTQEHKQEILELYRTTPETTSTLAERYDVSSSTISRFLKSSLSTQEYDHLIQRKRLARTKEVEYAPQQLSLSLPPEITTTSTDSKPKPKPLPLPIIAQTTEAEKPTPVVKEEPQPTIAPPLTEHDEDDEYDEDYDVAALGEMLGFDLDDDDDWNDEEDELTKQEENPQPQSFRLDGKVTILPLSKAILPKVCYVVISRRAELIAKPLKEFHHLGEIPKSELRQQTLPVFTNYRVARRFSSRFQRVIKIPNGSLLLKTSSHLLAKGINYLFLDNCLYSLVT